MSDTQVTDKTTADDSQKAVSNGRDSQLSSLAQLSDSKPTPNAPPGSSEQFNISITNVNFGNNANLYSDSTLPSGLQNIGQLANGMAGNESNPVNGMQGFAQDIQKIEGDMKTISADLQALLQSVGQGIPGGFGNAGTGESGNFGNGAPGANGGLGTGDGSNTSGVGYGAPGGTDNTGGNSVAPAGTDNTGGNSVAPAGTDNTGMNPITPTGAPIAGGDFQVGPNGFTGPDGQPFNMRGLNAGVTDALQGFPQVLQDYPNMTAIRLNVDPSQDSMDQISQVVQDYTSHGIVVEAEDHSGNGGNVDWYQQMAQTFKDNPYVMLETPNEPSGDAQSVANDQINIINAIRSTGYNNPIGVQPVGGYDQSNVPLVTSAVGNSQLYVTPHIYDSSTDPNDAAQYVNSEISQAQSNGMYSWIDEFGNAMDGVTMDPQGQATIDAVIAANQSGSSGAAFWGMDNGNHPDGADSAFLTPDGSQLTSTGQDLQNWI